VLGQNRGTQRHRPSRSRPVMHPLGGDRGLRAADARGRVRIGRGRTGIGITKCLHRTTSCEMPSRRSRSGASASAARPRRRPLSGRFASGRRPGWLRLREAAPPPISPARGPPTAWGELVQVHFQPRHLSGTDRRAAGNRHPQPLNGPGRAVKQRPRRPNSERLRADGRKTPLQEEGSRSGPGGAGPRRLCRKQ
jgi:hypothetical protein